MIALLILLSIVAAIFAAILSIPWLVVAFVRMAARGRDKSYNFARIRFARFFMPGQSVLLSLYLSFKSPPSANTTLPHP